MRWARNLRTRSLEVFRDREEIVKIFPMAFIVVCAVVIFRVCVKRNNPASADEADAEMVPADAIANPTLFRSLLSAQRVKPV